jgi:hypothetical protein
LRKAADSEVPVSTSVRMSLSSFATLALAFPRPTMSKDCISGTPAFIMVASWRVKIAMSLGLMDLPERMRRFLIFEASTPCRRSAACTWFSPAARSSPRTSLPLRSLPSHSKTNSLCVGLARGDATVAIRSPVFGVFVICWCRRPLLRAK